MGSCIRPVLHTVFPHCPIPSAAFLIRIWPALRGCGKGRVEPRSAWRQIMSQIKAKDVVRCIPHCSALRFWEEKCEVNGLGCRGLQNLDGLTGRFRGVLGSMYGLPHGSLQRTEAVIAVIVPVHHTAQMMLAGETALATQRPGIVIATTTPPCFCFRRDWHAEVKQSSMRTARAAIFRQACGTTFLPSCNKVQAERRGR